MKLEEHLNIPRAFALPQLSGQLIFCTINQFESWIFATFYQTIACVLEAKRLSLDQDTKQWAETNLSNIRIFTTDIHLIAAW